MRFYKAEQTQDFTLEKMYYADDWDIIELGIKFNPSKMIEWYNQLYKDFGHLEFDFQRDTHLLDIEDSRLAVQNNFCGTGMEGSTEARSPIYGFTLGWPVDRDLPMPPHNQANKDIFPETSMPNFMDEAKWLDKFKFGYINDFLNALEGIEINAPTLTIHEPNAEIKSHIDSKLKKIHIVIKTNSDNWFTFGENHARKYLMEPGRCYIINTHIHHGTLNKGNTPRAHILGRIDDSQILELLKINKSI